VRRKLDLNSLLLNVTLGIQYQAVKIELKALNSLSRH
jgi:hypothetical protein